MRTVRLLAFLSVFATWRLGAQSASPYLPINHWATPYIEHLITRGLVVDPTPLTRPWRQATIVQALKDADTTAMTSAERTQVARIVSALDDQEAGPRARLDLDVGVAAANFSRRDPLRADRTGRGTVNGGANLDFRFGPIVAVTHPELDTRLKLDPDWYGRKNRVIAGRTDEAYLSAQWRYGEVFFGSLDRNWGPSAVPGLLLSPNPYSLTHLGVNVGTTGFQLQAWVTQLNDLTDTTGAAIHRYMVQHRLWVKIPAGWTFALWEGSVTSGSGRTLEPWFANLMDLGYLEQVNTNTNVNSFLGLDFHARGRTSFFGQLLLDDIQVDKTTAADKKPSSYGVTLGAQGSAAGAAWTAFYTRVANLTYRNEDNMMVPLWFGLGTGRNYADYDQLTLRGSVLTGPGLMLEPEVTLLRQGEGDPRLPHPLVAAYPSTAGIFQGVVERTLRLALGARADGAHWGISGNAGLHFVHNEAHVTGVNGTRFVGQVAVTWRLGGGSVLP